MTWYPKAGNAAQQVFEYSLQLLRQGDYRTAEPLLRSLLAHNPQHADALYNLGMVLSDQRRTAEAIALLSRFVELQPDSSNGWTALGVARSRQGDIPGATADLQRALEIDPGNAYAQRNLGGLLTRQSPIEALPLLEKAARNMPGDQRSQYAYAQCLMDLDRIDEADPVFVRAIQLEPLSEIAEQARAARSAIAGRSLHSANAGAPRPDAVLYCLEGLKKFREVGDGQTRSIVYEIAMLGRGGFDINNPAKKHTLRSLPGAFSGLHLVSLMYTGLKLIQPSADAGIDLSREYATALAQFEKPQPPGAA